MEYVVSRAAANTCHQHKMNKFALVQCFLKYYNQQSRVIGGGRDDKGHEEEQGVYNPVFIDKMREYEARGPFYVVPEVVVDTRDA